MRFFRPEPPPAITSNHDIRSLTHMVRCTWGALAKWTACEQLNPSKWHQASTVLEWWEATTANTKDAPKKALCTLTLLVAWEIWSEMNRRTFQQKELSAGSLLAKIKEVAKSWSLAGARDLSS